MQIFFMTVPACRRIFHLDAVRRHIRRRLTRAFSSANTASAAILSARQDFRPLAYPFSAGGWLC